MSDREGKLETITREEADKLIVNLVGNNSIIIGISAAAVAFGMAGSVIPVSAIPTFAQGIVKSVSAAGIMLGGLTFIDFLYGTYHIIKDYISGAENYMQEHYHKQLIGVKD